MITNGSRIYVPENTAAVIMNQSGIEDVLYESGGYQYWDGQESVFNGNSIETAIIDQTMERVATGGISTEYKKIVFVNLKEIRDIKFGTQGPQVYHDKNYDTDLEVRAYGNFTIKVSDPELFIKNYVPANVEWYSFEEPKAKAQLVAEILQSFIISLNLIADNSSASSLPSAAAKVSEAISNDREIESWDKRFGIRLVKATVQNIEFTESSRELIRQYSSNRMNVKAYDGVSQKSADIAAKQNISQGVKEHGLGDAAGAVLGINIAQGMMDNEITEKTDPIDEQIKQIRKYKCLLDDGVLTEEEFTSVKKKILGI